MSATVQTTPQPATQAAGEHVRCFECRRVWPRSAMRWGERPAGPLWFARTVRVLRCPDCLPA